MIATQYVIGHRNPDTDSIAAALAYAELKQRQGSPGVIAAMAGEPNPQTRYVLDRLGIPDPLLLADVHPKVRDTLNRRPVTAQRDTTAYEALELFHTSGVRSLPVLDNSGKPCGILSLLRLSEKYLLPDTEHQREITTTLPALLTSLSARLAVDGQSDDAPFTLKLFIGAMREESFVERISGYDPRQLLIMTGNRESIQQSALERGVRVLVVTGGHQVKDDILNLAREKNVSILLTPFDTATAAWRARLSTPVSLFAEEKFATIGVVEPLSHLRQKLLTGEPAVLALEDDGTLAGVATKSSLLAPLPYSLILVDHNELGQAVPGAEAVEITEVIDHHKLGNNHTISPIAFITSPVGSSCTLVAQRYRECGMKPGNKIAAILMAGILSDTVILKSPTTTDADRSTLSWLEELSGLNAEQFGKEMFTACSSLKNFGSPKKVVESDYKIFSHDKFRIGVGQVEVVGFDEFHEMKKELLTALSTIRDRDHLFISGLMVTDITTETTLFLVEGHTRIAHVMEYPQFEPHIYELKNVMSRKKQLVPHLMKILAKL